MLHFTPGSHAHRLITLLSVVGEYPMVILSSQRELSDQRNVPVL